MRDGGGQPAANVSQDAASRSRCNREQRKTVTAWNNEKPAPVREDGALSNISPITEVVMMRSAVRLSVAELPNRAVGLLNFCCRSLDWKASEEPPQNHQ
jgi:hypothetical protein